MIALRLARLIERHADELAAELVVKFETSSHTAELRKVPVEELRGRIQEILRHLSDWLLTKAGPEIEQRYFEIGERRASQGGRIFSLLLGNCSDEGTPLGIPATPQLRAWPGRNLRRDGIVAPAGPVFRSWSVLCDGGL